MNIAQKLRDDIEMLTKEVFGLDLCKHEKCSGREIVGFLLKGDCDEDVTLIHLFGCCAYKLFETIQKGIPKKSLAGIQVDAGSRLESVPSFDILYISQNLLRRPRSVYLATLVHELCHLIVNTPIEWLEPAEDAKQAAPQIRTQTYGPDDDDPNHSDEWLSVLFEAAYRLHISNSVLFPSHEQATIDALPDVLVDGELVGVTWRS